MKKTILLLNTLMISWSAFGGTDVIYSTMSRRRESVAAGNIKFGKDGLFDARNVCFDQTNRVYKTTIPAHQEEKCSFPGLIVRLCTQMGGRIIYTNIPARDITAPEFIDVKKCTEYDRSSSTSPVCTEWETNSVQQPVDFEFLKYKIEIKPDYYGYPSSYEVRDLKICE